MSTFFVSAFLLSEYSNADCSISDYFEQQQEQLEQVQVKWVYDGDTVKLTDNRKVRIIGIDTPEVAHKRRKQGNGKENNNAKSEAEAYSGEATEALRELLVKSHYRITIKPGKQKKDKYGRLLAHVFTPNGTNVSEWLLQQGLATLLMIPPNTRFMDCYRFAEKVAQTNKRNIWQLGSHQIKTTASLGSRFSGYVRLSGTVKGIKRRKNKISIKLDHQIYITIKKPELKWFKSLDLAHLKGKSIQVTGILYRHGKKGYIRLRHPVYLNY